MTDVIKKNGAREAFDLEKVKKSIQKAMEDAGLSVEENKEKIEQIAKEVSGEFGSKEEVSTGEIREKVLSELDRVESKASEAWRKFDKERKNR